MTLYHLSKVKHDGIVMSPRIPRSLIVDFEDETTPRVCFSSTIAGACRAIKSWGGYGIYYLHVIDGKVSPKHIRKCTEEMVSDCIVTDEYWVTRDVKLKCIAKLSIGFSDRPSTRHSYRKYHYKKCYEADRVMDGYALRYHVHFKYLERYK